MLWIKSLHVMAIISWMAATLYLPRLFVYHASAAPGSDLSETFKVMERRLYRFIMTPAMIVAWITGLWMAWEVFGFLGGWLHSKLVLVTLLSAIHGWQGRQLRDFANDRNRRTPKFYRISNELPTLLMIGIVILVIVKPF